MNKLRFLIYKLIIIILILKSEFFNKIKLRKIKNDINF